MNPAQHEEAEKRLAELMALGWLLQIVGEGDTGAVPFNMLGHIGGLVAHLAGEASRDLGDIGG